MKRPLGITLTAILMAFKVCVGIGLILLSPHWFAANIHPIGHVTAASVLFTFRVAFFMATVVACVTIWAYWAGQFWVRRVVLLGCLFYLYQLVHLRTVWNNSHLQAAITVYGAILAVFLLWYLFTPEAKAWFPWPAAADRYRSRNTQDPNSTRGVLQRPRAITNITILLCVVNFTTFFTVDFTKLHTRGVIAYPVTLVAFACVIIFYFWKGRNWARWLVLADSVLLFFDLWGMLRSHSRHPNLYMPPVKIPLAIGKVLIAGFLLWYLNTREIRAWFTHPTTDK